jgi:amino acid transporter
VHLRFAIIGHFSQSGGYYSIAGYSFNSKVGFNGGGGRLSAAAAFQLPGPA